MDYEELIYRLWLERMPGVGCVWAGRLIDLMGSARALYECGDYCKLNMVEGLPQKAAENLIQRKDISEEKLLAEKIEKQKLGYVFYKTESYPEMLSHIYAPPQILFYRGENLFTKPLALLSVVGTRKATPYGISATKSIVSELVRSGISVVSGLALGIDEAAHTATLNAGGTTIGVMGCGTDYIYPASHRALYERIIAEGGMLISELIPDTPPIPANFPRRNRIISGLGFATLVTEASLKSGSLITASYALEQGRDVYAVPSPITSQSGRGANRLIKEGAKLVSCAEDILEDNFLVLKSMCPKSAKEELSKQKTVGLLSETEKFVYDCVLSGAKTADEIAVKGLKNVSTVSSALTMLELKQLVCVKNGAVFLLI